MCARIFCEADLGKNKAQVLAERYAGAFGLEAEYIPDFIESSERLAELLTSPPKMRRQLTILIGAVDNNRSRQLCHEVFYRSRDLIYIDSGNGEFSGQVCMRCASEQPDGLQAARALLP